MGLVGSGLAGGLGLVLGVLLVACGDDGGSSSSSGNSRYRTLSELQVTSNNECYPEDAVSASEVVAPCVQFYECVAQ